jgi:hypothetical protein
MFWPGQAIISESIKQKTFVCVMATPKFLFVSIAFFTKVRK